MSYEFTYTPRFKKHFKNLSTQEKHQLKSKPELIGVGWGRRAVKDHRRPGENNGAGVHPDYPGGHPPRFISCTHM